MIIWVELLIQREPRQQGGLDLNLWAY